MRRFSNQYSRLILKSPLGRYGAVCALVGLASLARLFVTSATGFSPRFQIFQMTVAFSALLGGLGPGLLALALSVWLTHVWSVPTGANMSEMYGFAPMFVFVLSGLMLTAVCTLMRRGTMDLAVSEGRYKALVQASAQIVWVTTADGYVVEDLPSWREFTGHTFEQTLGRGWTTAVHPADLPNVIAVWTKSLETGQPHENEFRLKNKHDQYRLMLARAVPLRDDKGRIHEWIGTLSDITESKRVSERLERTNRDLLMANEDLRQFAYSASHDLQEPLRMLSVYSQLLTTRKSSQFDEESLGWLEVIRGSAGRLENLLRDLLAYSRVAYANDFVPEEVDAGAALQSAIANLQTTIESSRAQVIAGTLPRVLVPSVYLLQLFQNLIGNAIKYSNNGTPPRIEISATNMDGFWQFAVKDNGIGISPNYHQLIFGVFKRLHTAAAYPGTGMGLAICYRIVERCGGKIWVESKLGQGSTFYFTLPDAAHPISELPVH